jgi:hypothetical protein
MITNYYVAADRITARISEDVNPGYHVRYRGERFEHVTRKPLGKSILKKLIKEDNSKRIILYR